MLTSSRVTTRSASAPAPKEHTLLGSKRALVDTSDETPYKRRRHAKVFPFFELPGEIQNRIYEYAAEETFQMWPDEQHPRLHARQGEDDIPALALDIHRRRKPFPFLSMTQTCAKMRVEFRGWWMSQHRIPLIFVERYLSVFFRMPSKKGKERYQAFYKPNGKLRIKVTSNELKDRDITRLLKFKTKMPTYETELEQCSKLCNEEFQGFYQLVNNQNSTWLHWLRSNVITQVLLSPWPTHKAIRIVVRERYAEAWMKQLIGNHMPDGFLASIGLDDIPDVWKVEFAVNYS